MIQERKYKFDNLRFILMFLVVFGHFLALQDEYSLYRFIYSFHMPAFIFISGYFAKYSRRRILEVFLMLAEKYFAFSGGEQENLLLTAVFSFLMMIVFGNSYAAALFEKIFTGKWIEAAVKRLMEYFRKRGSRLEKL